MMNSQEGSTRTILYRDTVVWVPVGDVLWPARILPRQPGSRMSVGDADLRCLEAFGRSDGQMQFCHVSRLHEYVSRRFCNISQDIETGRSKACTAAEQFITKYGTREQREALSKARSIIVKPMKMKLRLRQPPPAPCTTKPTVTGSEETVTKARPIRVRLALKRRASLVDSDRPIKLRRCDVGKTVVRPTITNPPVKLVLRIRKPQILRLPWCYGIENAQETETDSCMTDVVVTHDKNESDSSMTDEIASALDVEERKTAISGAFDELAA